MWNLLAELLWELVTFIARLIAQSLLMVVLDWLLVVLMRLVRTACLLISYPLMVLAGWLWQRKRLSPWVVWREHELHQLYCFGWQRTSLGVNYLLALLTKFWRYSQISITYLLTIALCLLAGTGIGLVVYFGSQHLF